VAKGRTRSSSSASISSAGLASEAISNSAKGSSPSMSSASSASEGPAPAVISLRAAVKSYKHGGRRVLDNMEMTVRKGAM